MWNTGTTQIQPQLGTQLRLVDGSELGWCHDPRARSIGHVDDGPHDQGGILAVLGDLCVALILGRRQQGRKRFQFSQEPINLIVQGQQLLRFNLLLSSTCCNVDRSDLLQDDSL